MENNSERKNPQELKEEAKRAEQAFNQQILAYLLSHPEIDKATIEASFGNSIRTYTQNAPDAGRHLTQSEIEQGKKLLGDVNRTAVHFFTSLIRSSEGFSPSGLFANPDELENTLSDVNPDDYDREAKRKELEELFFRLLNQLREKGVTLTAEEAPLDEVLAKRFETEQSLKKQIQEEIDRRMAERNPFKRK